MTPQAKVEQFIDHWNNGDLEAVYAMCSDDIEWHNMPMDPIIGIEAMQQATASFMDAVDRCDWSIHTIAANGNVVLTERIDAFALKNGKQAILPVMGIFEIDEQGKIAKWRDYFDMGQFQREFGG